VRVLSRETNARLIDTLCTVMYILPSSLLSYYCILLYEQAGRHSNRVFLLVLLRVEVSAETGLNQSINTVERSDRTILYE
jgi:hypothetical protein